MQITIDINYQEIMFWYVGRELNKDNMKKTIYSNIIILENDDYALVMPKYSLDGFINYYN
jgi:hypothetical protein